MKILLIIFLGLLFLSPLVSSSAAAIAGAAAAAAASAHNREEAEAAKFIANQQNSGCKPPEEFAEEHKCTLKYDTLNRVVGAYYCDNNQIHYSLISKCDGEIIKESHYSSPFVFDDPNYTLANGILLLVCAIIILLIVNCAFNQIRSSGRL